jgi:predicted integral membrane protein DUF2269
MSFTDRLVLWLHVGFAIFTIGPVTVAIMSTPRYIRKRNVVIVRYLYRTTRLFTVISLAVLIVGVVLANQLHDFSKPWLSVSLTLFVVAIALLVLVMRDQHRAIAALEEADEVAADDADQPAAEAGERSERAQVLGSPLTAEELHPHVERGRITSLGGVVSVIWLVILVLMVWNG